MIPPIRDTALAPIWEKVRDGKRLSLEDGRALFATDDLLSLGRMAHFAQRRKSGDAVYFVLNQKIEHTNICVLSCKFCDFAVKKSDPEAYEMTSEEILARLTPEISEVHVTGGMPADWPWERYLDIVRSIRDRFPRADVKAFTAVEIDFFAKKFRKSIEQVLIELKEAGLRTMPGGGAEVFSERVRRLLFNQKIGAKGWFEVHRTAHRLGIPTNSTLLYGHIETTDERLIHMMKLREAQDETGGFLTFIPLAFQPGDTGIKPARRFTSAVDDLKTIAVSRLMLDNFPHIKAYWVMLTEEVASIALNFGADDIDGTVGHERIAHDAGAVSPMALATDQLVRMIRGAGKIAVERDVYYNPLRIHHMGDGERVIGKIPYLNSLPFYTHLRLDGYRILPSPPRRMGVLAGGGQLDAGLYSLMDYFRHEDSLERLDYCIATRDQVKSVMLFSKEGWSGLDGKTIGVTDETATSVVLLRLLLETRHGVRARFSRMHGGVNDCSAYDAVLLIGDQALVHGRHGLPGFELVYDLAREWYDWKKMPFVFAVWAVRRSLPDSEKARIAAAVGSALGKGEGMLESIGAVPAESLGLEPAFVEEYLEGFSYRFGEREKEAVAEFRRLVSALAPESAPEEAARS